MRHGHFVQFFGSEGQHADAVAWFVKETLDAGSTCIVVATPEHRSAIASRVRGLGLDIAAAAAAYQYIELDAQTVLSGFLEGTRCNRQKFHSMLDTLLRQAASRGAPVRIFGEMVSLLAQDGLTDAALELEELWNELSRHHHFTLFCGYCEALLPQSIRMRHALERVRALHERVVTN